MGIGQKKQKPESLTFTCKQCGGSFERKTAFLNTLSKRFCGPLCASMYRKDKHKAKARRRPTPGAESKPVARRKVKERDGHWCLLCGRPGPGLHLHRVEYGSEGGKYVPTNCVLLCDSDHKLIHSNKKLWQPRLMVYLQYPDRSAHDWLPRIEEQHGLA